LAFDPIEDQRAVEGVGDEINRYLNRETDVLRRKIDLTLVGNAFQKKILVKLQRVPRGALISYQALGAAAGSASAARAVGNALHNNPIAVYVPCHRVISSDGRIGGYAGGTARKLKLLRSEGFAVHGGAISNGTVWGHRGTKIYCRQGCRTTALVDRTQILRFTGPDQARRAGMRACKICRPG
jgi:O-6-methylguanine DNA methyltransferase